MIYAKFMPIICFKEKIEFRILLTESLFCFFELI